MPVITGMREKVDCQLLIGLAVVRNLASGDNRVRTYNVSRSFPWRRHGDLACDSGNDTRIRMRERGAGTGHLEPSWTAHHWEKDEVLARAADAAILGGCDWNALQRKTSTNL